VITGLYKSAWGALGSQIRQEAIANNMANVNTAGFRPDWAVMRSYRSRAEQLDGAVGPQARAVWQAGGGGMVVETRTVQVAGPVQSTGVATDLAIVGERGFFTVEKDGQVRYTRAGNFRVDAAGRLVTADGGWRVLGEDGLPLEVGAADFRVDGDGRIRRTGREGEEEVGQFALADFEDPAVLTRTDGVRFAAPAGAARPAEAGSVRVEQGALEMSGTNAAQTMIGMIEALRSYEANLNFVRIQDQLLGRAVTEIARLGG
jgi:flagellar basal body rod protein FlgG